MGLEGLSICCFRWVGGGLVNHVSLYIYIKKSSGGGKWLRVHI